MQLQDSGAEAGMQMWDAQCRCQMQVANAGKGMWMGDVGCGLLDRRCGCRCTYGIQDEGSRMQT